MKINWPITALVFITCINSAVLADVSVGQAIGERIEQLRETGQVSIDGALLAAVRLIPEIYERRGFEPAWTRPQQVASLIEAVKDSYDQGLDMPDYHADRISAAYQLLSSGENIAPRHRADIDLLLTDSLIRMGYHLRFGKVNPEELDPDWNFRRELGGQDPATIIHKAIDSGSVTEFIDDALPRGFVYQRLRNALSEYRAIKAAGGWPAVASGPTLKPGMSDARVPVLITRLQISGDLADTYAPTVPGVYDETVEQAIKRFQRRHRLTADGIVGSATLAALNVPVEDRIAQIRVNLERARWVFDDIEDEFIVVNIAAFRVYLVRDRKIVWTARAQVGKPFRKTPVFKSKLKYLVFNPTWTVPPGILAKDILPRAKRDPAYLQSKNIDIRDNSGAIVDPSSIDWASVSARGFPYQLVQRPGPTNALGRVKFIFPNEHFVFLHDTPSKALFDRTERAFSSGCIRVQSPFDLASLLLENKGWDSEKVEATVESEKTQTVFLSKPITVALMYFTVTVDDDGRVNFQKDIYGRDKAVSDGLKAPFRLDLPRG
jgi:murein L,D-transpeptidase YcbB/YkuD